MKSVQKHLITNIFWTLLYGETLNEQNQKMHKAALKQRMAADKGSRASEKTAKKK